MIGKVLRIKVKNSAVVEVTTVMKHPLYKKRIQRRKRFLAHDDLGVKEGDKVSIKSVRPISKRKRFKVTEILK